PWARRETLPCIAGRAAARFKSLLTSAGISSSRYSDSLSSVGEFPRGVSPLEGPGLTVLDDEFPDDVRELRDPELQSLVGDEPLFGLAGKKEKKASVLFQDDLELGPGGSLVCSRELP